MKLVRPLLFALGAGLAAPGASVANAGFTNSIGQRFAEVPAGEFNMGSTAGDRDETPVRRVRISRSFHLSTTEVTNAQYEQFDPAHRSLRGKLGFSTRDDEPAVFVSWHDAVAFCEWLSAREGRHYRLPTEAEWEYAARAGTATEFNTGDDFPEAQQNHQVSDWWPSPNPLRKAGEPSAGGPAHVAPLLVGRFPANAWGLHDMHGNVEEWCADWHGPYQADETLDPVGAPAGDFRVTRGGSHSTETRYLRSANRSGTLPADRSWLIGFRVLAGPKLESAAATLASVPPSATEASSEPPTDVADGPDPARPYFSGPIRFVRLAPGEKGPWFPHNHDASVTETPNGDLLAIWYTCRLEQGRELHYVSSRFRCGATEWEPASASFWSPPDRNAHAGAIWWDGARTLYHFNGLSVAGTWGNLALTMRTSTDNGTTWSPATFVNPEHGARNQPTGSVLRLRDGTLVVCTDAVPSGNGGTAIWLSRDDGESWFDPGAGQPAPRFAAGESGAWIAGIHASVVELTDGRLLALGRGDAINGQMPRSVSSDGGKTWTYSPSGLPRVSQGQQLALIRLREGPLLLASFSPGMPLKDRQGRERTGRGLFVALSYDEGETWPVRRLVTDEGEPRELDGGAWTGKFTLGPFQAEPKGYLAACQQRNGVINLLTSALHYRFNLAWIERRTMPPG